MLQSLKDHSTNIVISLSSARRHSSGFTASFAIKPLSREPFNIAKRLSKPLRDKLANHAITGLNFRERNNRRDIGLLVQFPSGAVWGSVEVPRRMVLRQFVPSPVLVQNIRPPRRGYGAVGRHLIKRYIFRIECFAFQTVRKVFNQTGHTDGRIRRNWALLYQCGWRAFTSRRGLAHTHTHTQASLFTGVNGSVRSRIENCIALYASRSERDSEVHPLAAHFVYPRTTQAALVNDCHIPWRKHIAIGIRQIGAILQIQFVTWPMHVGYCLPQITSRSLPRRARDRRNS